MHVVFRAQKSALDWLVSGLEFVDKPAALLSASSRSTLTTMSGRFVAQASITVPLLGRNLDAPSIAADGELSRCLRGSLVALCRAIRQQTESGAAESG